MNKPMVMEILAMLNDYYSVEKIIIANQTRDISPSLFAKITKAFGENIPVETLDHTEIKKLSKTVKTVIRTGDFTAYGNVILVSGAGNRWFCENEN